MDNKKDNKSLVPDSGVKSIVTFSLFERDNILLFSYKKAERIVSAIYLVTNFFSDTEPLKREFRQLGLQIINQILDFKSNLSADRDRASSLLGDIVRLMSFLDIGKVAELVSEMNYSVIKTELDNLLQSLSYKSPDFKDRNHSIDKEFFGIPENQMVLGQVLPEASAPSFPAENHGETNDGKPMIYNWSEMRNYIAGYKGHYKRQSENKTKGHSTKKSLNLASLKNISPLEMRGEDREAVIIDLLKRKNPLNIKDFGQVIKGCSEKTIQRELMKLVGQGVLKREGERRWSRYSLII